MHTGLGLQFDNLDGKISDAEVYRRELRPRRTAPRTPASTRCGRPSTTSRTTSSPRQTPMFLSWVAGQTTRVKLGAMVTVLPWHDPVRVAESYSRARPPLGRPGDPRASAGASGSSRVRRLPGRDGRVASAVHGVQRGDPRGARDRRTSSTTASSTSSPASRSGRSRCASFKGRTFASAVSPESMEIMARMGVGLMVIAQKPWETAEAELEAYRQRYLELNGHRGAQADPGRGRRREPRTRHRPSASATSTCSGGPARRSSTTSSTTTGSPTSRATSTTPRWRTTSTSTALEKFNGFLADLQVWGTPDEVHREAARLRQAHRRRWAGRPPVRSAACPPTRRAPASTSSPPRCSPSSSATTSAVTSA